MKVRKPILAEWFLHYQLSASSLRYVHLPFTLDVDISELVYCAKQKGMRFSPTAVTIKAVSILASRMPELNRVLFHSPFGLRIGEPSEVRVNLPVLIDNGGSSVLSAMVLGELDKKNTGAIHAEIAAFKKTDLSDKPIGRLVHNGRFTWYNRLALRLIYFVAHRLPKFYMKKGGGAFSVTSLMHRDVPHMWLRGTGIGHTALTVTVNGVKETSQKRFIMLLGIDCNHSVLSGDEFAEACAHLSQILTKPDLVSFFG